ncbi:hypothetical protein Q4485_14270 [Granulosicoccaceae sp. 1_MG-2023]|nr:hypothetical protein [Granulosicoccaceae sp. 1_MG-2023]
MKTIAKLSALFAVVILTLAAIMLITGLIDADRALAFVTRGLATVVVLGMASALISLLTSPRKPADKD